MASSTSNISRKHLKPSPQRNRKCHMRTILVVEVSTHMGVVLWFVPKKNIENLIYFITIVMYQMVNVWFLMNAIIIYKN